jgi:hypothetical protein
MNKGVYRGRDYALQESYSLEKKGILITDIKKVYNSPL